MATAEGQARNEEIFRTAAELMVQRGYAGTSMGDLAKAIGMTKAGLYHHINSKQDMLFQILLHAMEALERAVIEPAKRIADPEERLREMIRLHVRGLFDHGLEFALLFPERRHLEPDQQRVVVQQIGNYLALLREAMRELSDEGKLRDLDIDIAARHLLQTIAGIARWYNEDSEVSKDLLVEQTVNFNMAAVLNAS
ncbi:TetR/AcrR family transcriptional regulator [Akkermansiaceae bacterium]|nr:TetR/AcrR family transcriptional regulator [Akkermansiaceae bacterium]